MKLSASKILIFILLGFFAGVFSAPLLGFSWWIFGSTLILLALIFFFFRDDFWVKSLAIFGIGLILAFSYYHFYLARQQKSTIQNYNYQEVYVIGYISAEPDIRADKTKYTVQVQRFEDASKGAVSGKILVTVRRMPEFHFADQLKFKGNVEQPKEYEDFNYKNYLARYQIYSIVNYPDINLVGSALDDPNISGLTKSWLRVQKFLLAIKSAFTQKISQLIPEPWAAFLGGLLLGAKKAIPQNLMDIFNQTGTSHIVVISGYNITIIIGAFMKLTKNWSKKLAYTLAILMVLAFVIMTGAQAPVLRAAIMAGLVIWAERAGRKSDVTIALVLTAGIMILINPLILRFDVGFQLSFLATLGLVYFSPIVEKLFTKPYLVRVPKLISEPAIATLSAQIMVVPVILFNFGRFSTIAPLANILVLPLVPWAMLFGFAAGLIAFVWLPLGQIIAWSDWLILKYMTWILTWCSKIPAAYFQVNKFSWLWIAGYYLLIAGFLIWYNRKERKNR